MPRQLVWFITGTSTGFGRDLALAAVQRGDKVIATARRLSAVEDLKAAGASTLQLDVTSPLEALKSIAKEAHEIHGRIDVVVNNAGYFETGALEENTPEETLKQFNTNVFGAMNVARAFLPYQREAKTGTILWIGSGAGWISVAGCSLYCATKHAVRAIAESLHDEVAPLGIRSIYLEPGYFRTSFMAHGKREFDFRIEDYKTVLAPRYEEFEVFGNNQPGDPRKLVQLLIDFVKLEGPFSKEKRGGKDIPIGFPVGSDAYTFVSQQLKNKMKVLEDWKDVICSTDL